MEGFLRLRLAPWARRLLTRGLAIIPGVAVTALYGESGTAQLLVLSQIILAMQLPFAIIPLVWFVSDRAAAGEACHPRPFAALAWALAALIVGLNLKLLFGLLLG